MQSSAILLPARPMAGTLSCPPSSASASVAILGHGLSPKLNYYIARDHGIHVPLIPADELPHDYRLHGISRTINPDQARAQGMTFLGPQKSTGRTFVSEHGQQVAGHAHVGAPAGTSLVPATLQFFAPDATVNGGAPTQQSPTVLAQAANEVDATVDANTHSGSATDVCVNYPLRPRRSYPSGIEPDESKKVYCTHWIGRGECDFNQQGCKYKHIMPDEAGLFKLGFIGYPRWWLVLHPELQNQHQQQSPQQPKWTRSSGHSSSTATWFKKQPHSFKGKGPRTTNNRCQTKSDTDGSDRAKKSGQKHSPRKHERAAYSPSSSSASGSGSNTDKLARKIGIHASRHAGQALHTVGVAGRSTTPLSLATSRHAPPSSLQTATDSASAKNTLASSPAASTTGDLISFDLDTVPASPTISMASCPSTASSSGASAAGVAGRDVVEPATPPTTAAVLSVGGRGKGSLATPPSGKIDSKGKGKAYGGGSGGRKKAGYVSSGSGSGSRSGGKGGKGKGRKVEVVRVLE